MTADATRAGNPAESLALLGGSALGPQDPVMVGEYRIHALLGIGGMGRVYLGWAQQPGFAPGASGAWVAVKVIRPDLADNPEFRRRFARELEAVGLVRTRYAAGLVHGEPAAPQPWMATVFVPGVALADAVRPGDPLPAASVWRLAHDLGSALTAVHQAGIVHRDVKPSNVILGSDGAKLIDFGVAYASELSQLTTTGMNIGTPSYMAPEQAKSGEVSPASDIFSLGVLLFFAATGRLPFGEGGTAEVLFRVVYEEPDLSGLDRLEQPLRDLILSCMAKAPLGRPNAGGVVVMAENAAAADLWSAQQTAVWPESLAVRISERMHAAGRTLPDPSLYPNSSEQAVAEAPSPTTYQISEPPMVLPPVDSMPTVYTGFADGAARREIPKRRGILIAGISTVAVLGVGGATYAVWSPGPQSSTRTLYVGSTGGGPTSIDASDVGPAAGAPRAAVSSSVPASASSATSAGAKFGASPHPGASIGTGGVAISEAPAHPSTTPSSVTHGPVVVATPTPSSESPTKVAGSIQCQSHGVEGVWIQSANGGSGWAPWQSSAANPSYATYWYTLPQGGEYSVHVGCGGTPSAWSVATYSSFYGGTTNNFYCYDENSSSLYTYCTESK